jgi:2-polyprenyl-3-methyl-5-hydroxy-6-metoxy-1,4-benzoquinol methylase
MIDYERIRSFYDSARSDLLDDPDFLRGTVESSVGVARFRFRAEARHLRHVVSVAPGEHVLDLGGGTGRWSLWFAEQGASVTMVELAPSLVTGAQRNAARRGLSVECLVGSILAPPVQARRFDLIHIGGVLVYINDDDLPRLCEVLRAHAQPGARLVVREPVDPNGPSVDEREGGYRALFRPPEVYAALFAADWQLQYERTTVSHLVPRGRSTLHVAKAAHSSVLKRKLVETVLPWVGYVDYQLLQLEERLRSSPAAALLGDPGVVQHFYVFQRR